MVSVWCCGSNDAWLITLENNSKTFILSLLQKGGGIEFGTCLMGLSCIGVGADAVTRRVTRVTAVTQQLTLISVW